MVFCDQRSPTQSQPWVTYSKKSDFWDSHSTFFAVACFFQPVPIALLPKHRYGMATSGEYRLRKSPYRWKLMPKPPGSWYTNHGTTPIPAGFTFLILIITGFTPQVWSVLHDTRKTSRTLALHLNTPKPVRQKDCRDSNLVSEAFGYNFYNQK